jgi:excisionase family DNA binding protein
MLTGMQTPPLNVITVSEAARALSCSEATVRRLCDRGTLSASRLASGMRLIDPASLARAAK